MHTALVGMPQSGKSTLFDAVTGRDPDPAKAYEVRRAVVPVPDERLAFLARLYKPRKVINATVEFVDFPGAPLTDAHGRERFARQLPAVRQCDLLAIVVRGFENRNVPSPRHRLDPAADLRELHEEFVLADLEQVANRIDRLEHALKKPTGTHEREKREQALLHRCREVLEASQPLSAVVRTEEEARLLSGFQFLTTKVVVVVNNLSEPHGTEPPEAPPPFATAVINLCAESEAQIARLDPEDRAAFLADLGVESAARDRLIQACHRALGLISFLTVGRDEVRAWTIRKGTCAVEAAGKIHTDLARGFIRAETVAFADLQACGDMKAAKAAGRVRQEGKSYVVQDGDMLNIKFNL